MRQVEVNLYVEPGWPFGVVSFLIWFLEGMVYVTFEVLGAMILTQAA